MAIYEETFFWSAENSSTKCYKKSLTFSHKIFVFVITVITIIGIIWVIFSLLVGAVGSGRSTGFIGALLLALLLSPIVGLIIVLLSKSKTSTP
jgi:hypothetical protein